MRCLLAGVIRSTVSWLEQKRNRLRQEEKSETERQKTLERGLEGIRMSPKGRHAKSKARISSYENLLSQETEARARDLEIFISEYEADRKARLGAAASQPHRIKYRQLTRV